MFSFPPCLFNFQLCFLYSIDSLQKLIQKTMVLWAEETFISSPDLIREMFSLLHRQYNGIGEVTISDFILVYILEYILKITFSFLSQNKMVI